eukprot:765096-Hanusia_phi.AAC.1
MWTAAGMLFVSELSAASSKMPSMEQEQETSTLSPIHSASSSSQTSRSQAPPLHSTHASCSLALRARTLSLTLMRKHPPPPGQVRGPASGLERKRNMTGRGARTESPCASSCWFHRKRSLTRRSAPCRTSTLEVLRREESEEEAMEKETPGSSRISE